MCVGWQMCGGGRYGGVGRWVGVEGIMGVVADVWEVLLGVFSVVNRGDGVATSHTLSWGS